MDYYTKQLEKLSLTSGEILKIKLSDQETQTNWLSLNNESAQAIINFLTNNFID